MSWLSDIAGKAENFLNAMDKSAASVVSSATEVVANSALMGATLTGSSPGHSAPSSRRHSRKHSMRSDLGDLDRRSTTTSTAFDTEFIETPDIMSLKTSTSTNSLYSSNGNGNGNGGSTSATKNGSHHHHHQRNSSFGSVGSNGNGKGFTSRNNDTTNFEDDHHLMEFLNSKEPANIPEEDQGGWAAQHQNSDHHLEPSPSFVVGGDDTASSHSAAEDGASHSDGHSNSSAPQNQDHLQQVKIDALSKELSGLQKRYADLLSEYKSMQKRAVAFHNQNVGSEKALREARSRESDLLAALQAKDSQIAALKVSLEALEAEAQRRTSTLQSLETAHQALQQELEESRNLLLQSQQLEPQPPEEPSSVDPEVLAALQAKVLSLKTTLQEERDQSQRLVEGHRETLGRLEDTQRSLVEQLEAARREAAEARRATAEAELASGPALQRAASLEAELAEFRLKASRTLADKEETIRRLQEISSGGGKEEAETQQSGEPHHLNSLLLQEQVNALNLELADLQAKFTATRAALDRAEGEALPRAQYEIRSLQEALQREQATVGRLQADVHQLSGQAATAAEEAASLRASLSARIAERDEEIEKLRRQLVARQKTTASVVQSSSSSAVEIAAAASSEEWEQRLRTLTESLIGKQAAVEQLSSANHSLKLQLERAEQRLREMAASSGTAALNNDVAIGIYHSPTFTNYIKHRMTGTSGMADHNSMSSSASSLLMEEGPNDGQVTRKVKRAYGAIDAFSIRLGNFLRVYPSARAAFLVYILVLHLWVAFVLLYYEPEVHGPDFHHGGGGGGENSANNPSNPLDLVPKGA